MVSEQRCGKTVRVKLGRSAQSQTVSTVAGPCVNSSVPARDPLAAAEAYRAHGSELWAAGQTRAALDRWRRGLQAADDSNGKVPTPEIKKLQIPLRLNIAQALIHLAEYAEARLLLTEVLDLEPKSAKAHYRLAQVLAGLGEWESAEMALFALDTLGETAAASSGRRSLRERKKKVHKAEAELAARMIGSSASASPRCIAEPPVEDVACTSVVLSVAEAPVQDLMCLD